MDWIKINEINQLEDIRNTSFDHPVVIFKHSTRCSISSMALNRLERDYKPGTKATFFFLDLLSFRNISAVIADTYAVHHESPQILCIKNGECIYDASHVDIRFDELSEQIDTSLAF